ARPARPDGADGLPPAPRVRPSGPAGGALPRRRHRLLATVRRQQQHGARRPGRSRPDRHSARGQRHMSGAFAILFNGDAATDLDANLTELQVEENLDLPGAFQLVLPVTRTDKGDVDMPS